ncbi:HD domain-containing protein [bacterium]|nr:HD domain-containing protein [bacterium]MBU4602663.1 HD domain-containing protein [bacterium]MCG2762143.1 HD domain-containing protein [Candidatus Atribacteria bacterium]
MNKVIYEKGLDISYEKILRDYLRTGQEKYLYQIAQFGKELMRLGIGPESIIEIHLNIIKKINRDEKVYSKKDIDKSFTVLMEGIMAYGMAYREYLDSRTEGYLAEIRELNIKLSRKLTEMTVLYDTIKITGSSLDLKEVLSSVFINTIKTLKAEDGSLMLIDPEDKVLTIKEAYGLEEDIIKKTRIKLGEGIAGLVAQKGEPLIISGRLNSPQIKRKGKYEGINSICAPLKTKKGVIGIINLNRKVDAEPFTEDDLKLLSTIAHEAATVIERVSLYQELHKTYLSTINAIAKIVEIRDPYTAGHQKRVAKLVCAIAEEMSLPQDKTEGLYAAGILHDIGKMNVPAEILSKPGRLSEIELGLIKTHPQAGSDIIKEMEFPWAVSLIVLQHHERLNGSGYPQGLKGEDILMEAKIIGVADVVEAMSSHRPYRPALGIDKVLEEISQNRGILYDREVVDACLKLFKEKGFKFE